MVIFRSITVDKYKNVYMTFHLLYAFHQTPFGKCLIAITDTDEDVTYLGFADEDESEALKILKLKWPMTKILEDTENKTKAIIEKIFHPDTSRLHSIRVLMKDIGNPKAAIAVGSAISKNYIAYIVPCHRVKGKNGSNNYSWGVERKEAMLEYERQHT
ncbi:methylated-DNA--[protein]-cysteine S-methyltransferase [Camponotus japonicus]